MSYRGPAPIFDPTPGAQVKECVSIDVSLTECVEDCIDGRTVKVRTFTTHSREVNTALLKTYVGQVRLELVGSRQRRYLYLHVLD
eukprot:SAG31_NODE_6285_length_2084_cov_3.501259_1_plen_84_part_10